MKNSAIINKKKVNGFVNEEELLLLLDKYSGLLIALGIEKILIDDENFEKIINSNLCSKTKRNSLYKNSGCKIMVKNY